VIDDRGRLLGVVNLIDALLVVVVGGVVAVVYGAFLLFRTPVPTIVSVTPTRIDEQTQATLKVAGKNLRPYLRAWAGMKESSGFLVLSPTQGEVLLPPLPSGTYDLVLFDEAQELARMPAAFKVGPAAQTTAQLRVRFLVVPELLPLLKPGDVDLPVAGSSTASAVLTSIGPSRSVTAAVQDYAFDRTFQTAQDMREFVADVRVPVTSSPKGWLYRERAVKVGASLRFESTTGAMVGSIQDVQIAQEENGHDR
jgi:hypothetical protein